MADLLDIVGPAVETVEISGGQVTVRALGLQAIATIMTRFPQSLAVWFTGGNAESLAHLGLAVPAIIAGGCDHLGDEKYEKAAGGMLPEDQAKMVAAIMRTTFPKGFDSFLETVMALFPKADEGVKFKPVKVRLKQSASASPPSSDTASLPTTQ